MTINYDRPVADFIDELNRTGHVTHGNFNKTSVTFHHNAGDLDFDDILRVWTHRPASAHFDVDSEGDVAQYVEVDDYAWAVGDTEGNRTSISIEQANSTRAPHWRIRPRTWKSAARLAGWLFANVIGERPHAGNVFQHKDWSSTSCAGPYFETVDHRVLTLVQQAYDEFVDGGSPPAHDRKDKRPDHNRKSNREIAAEVWNGEWGVGVERKRRLTEAGYNYNAIQRLVNQGVGRHGPHRDVNPDPGPTHHRKTLREVAAEVWNGEWGNGAERKRRIRAAGYDYDAVQALVNRGVGRHVNTSGGGGGGKSVNELATEVINGEWGNGAERKRRLLHAGYDYDAVQAEVNRRLL